MPADSSGSGQEDREATYIGATFLDHDHNEQWADAIGEDECITRIPQGVMSAVCDGEEGTGGDYDGIGGVKFCAIMWGATITVTIDDDRVGAPVGSLFCPIGHFYTEDHAGPGSYRIGIVERSGTFEVPLFCAGDDEGTELFLLMHAGNATVGTVRLEFLQ